MVSPDALRAAMGKFATGVAIVTTLSPDGAPHGMTANALTSVSLEPPLVLVCISHLRNTYGYVQARRRFGVNFLAQGQADIARYFARDPAERLGDVHVPWQMGGDGSPRIAGAIAFMECLVAALHHHGDHAIVVAQVQEAVVEGGKPLLYYERQLWGMDSGVPAEGV
ncbi:MAG: flavin reductase family protein [Chloroflexi bacterium]|nr:flavin reductase family protein [Chloroflexota bacterium]